MFTVVIPLYNKAHTIESTLNSVLRQTFAVFEVIVVNDGSVDGGAELVKRSFNDPRIRLIHQEHQGVSVARNRGVAEAENELVAFLDADDIWFPNYLQTISEVVNMFPESCMYCCAGYTLYPDSSGYSRTSWQYRAKGQRVDFFRGIYFFADCSSLVVRKSGFLECGGFPPGMTQAEDTVLLCKLALRSSTIYCSMPLVIYRKGILGQASESNFNKTEAMLDCFNKIYSYWSGLAPQERDTSFVKLASFAIRGALLKCIFAGNHSQINKLFGKLDPGLARYFISAERSAASSSLARLIAVLHYCFLRSKESLRFCPKPNYFKCAPDVVFEVLNK